MPTTTESYTVRAGDHPVRFRLEIQTRLGIVEGAAKECTYVCEECGCLMSTFVGTPDDPLIPADVLESMTEHGQTHR